MNRDAKDVDRLPIAPLRRSPPRYNLIAAGCRLSALWLFSSFSQSLNINHQSTIHVGRLEWRQASGMLLLGWLRVGFRAAFLVSRAMKILQAAPAA